MTGGDALSRLIIRTAERIKAEVLEDIRNGIVPASVTTFSDLHSYVDANTYGGLCDDDCPAELGTSEAALPNVNAVQDIVDRWLRQGRPA